MPSVIAGFMPLLSVFIAEETLCNKDSARRSRNTRSPPNSRDMNLNDFVVLPNNKAKSVKLNAR